jgi:hypothetical protein
LSVQIDSARNGERARISNGSGLDCGYLLIEFSNTLIDGFNPVSVFSAGILKLGYLLIKGVDFVPDGIRDSLFACADRPVSGG